MMEWIKHYAPLLQLLISLGSVAATFLLLYLNIRANRMAQRAIREMRLSREQENRPYVIFDWEMDGNEVYFVLRNDGRTEAFDVQLKFVEPLRVWNALVGEKVYSFQDMAISQPLDFLAPGDSFREWMDDRPRFFRNNELRHLSGSLSYQDAQGATYQMELDINLEPYYRQSQLLRKDAGDMIKVIKNIQRHVERLP